MGLAAGFNSHESFLLLLDGFRLLSVSHSSHRKTATNCLCTQEKSQVNYLDLACLGSVKNICCTLK